MGLFNVCLLPLLGSAAKQNYEPFPIPAKVDSISGTEIQPQLGNTRPNSLRYGEIATLHSQYRGQDSRLRARIQAGDPSTKGVLAFSVNVFDDLDHS